MRWYVITIMGLLMCGLGWFVVPNIHGKVLLHSWATIMGLLTFDLLVRKGKRESRQMERKDNKST